MFDLGPLMVILFVVCLAAARWTERFVPRRVIRASLLLATASLTAAIVVELIYRATPGFQHVWSIPLTFLFYAAFFVLYYSLHRTPRPSFVATSGWWLLFLLIVLAPTPRDYDQNIWLLDLLNKATPTGLIGRLPWNAAEAVTRAFALVNLHVARFFLPLAGAVATGLAYLAFIVLLAIFGHRRVPKATALAPPRIAPPMAVAIGLAAFLVPRYDGPWVVNYYLTLVTGIGMGMFFAYGLATLWRAGSTVLWALAGAAFVTGHGVEAVAVWGWLQNLVGVIPPPQSPDFAPPESFARFGRRVLSRRGLLLSGLLAMLLAFALSITGESTPPQRAHPTKQTNESQETMVRISLAEGFVWMDRFEFPNREGETPLVGVLPHEAAADCAMNGKRLCTQPEIAAACGQQGRRFLFANNPGESKRTLNGRCNVLPLNDAPRGVLPSGAMPCASENDVYDLTGNLWEWVGPVAKPWAYATGACYLNNDFHTTQCGFTLKLHVEQIEKLDRQVFGFRCCRDGVD
ncbi:MAG: SUMF1/EgtB/PvdO family nonheme iron enzyme [Candidatus Lernaella stagnicola]|nr:SUMF1/EgtB/PvdO family nonheme iron enzyme [Candidatus Lernaella stagnicola]